MYRGTPVHDDTTFLFLLKWYTFGLKDWYTFKLKKTINYFGRFKGYELSKVFRLLKIRLIRWARQRYKRYRNSLTKACQWYNRVHKQFPNLFYHWQLGFSN